MPLDVLGLTDDASVRPAVPADANAVAAIMARSYRSDYADALPASMLAELTPEVLVPGWSGAIGSPPSAGHRVLVACSGATVVGYAAVGPSPDEDAGAQDGELLALEVDPMNRRAGHASRLRIRQGAAPPSGHAEASVKSHAGSVSPTTGPYSQRPRVSSTTAISAPLAS